MAKNKIELEVTVEEMLSDDYKERFWAEILAGAHSFRKAYGNDRQASCRKARLRAGLPDSAAYDSGELHAHVHAGARGTS